MKHPYRPAAALVTLLLGISAVPASAQDWPQWRGVNRDGKGTGFEVPQKWPSALKQSWKVVVGSGDATPALVNDRLYVFTRQGADEVIQCLEADTGKEVWRSTYPAKEVTGPAGRHPGPRSSPAVAGGKVVVLGVGGVLTCLDAATGKVLWRNDQFTDVPTFFTAMSPIVVDDLCIAHLGAGGTGALVAMAMATGSKKWEWDGDMPTYSSPVVTTVAGTKQLVLHTETNLVGIAVADGKLLWKIPTPTAGRGFYNSATPVVDGQTVIYTGQGSGTRAIKLEKREDGFAAPELWHNEEIGSSYNTPVLKDGLLFGISSKHKCAFCLDARTGKTVWTDTKLSDGFGTTLDAGAVILAQLSTGELVAFEPSNKGYSELARIKVAETPVYSYPVIAGNRIYVKDEDTLARFTLGED